MSGTSLIGPFVHPVGGEKLEKGVGYRDRYFSKLQVSLIRVHDNLV